MIQKVKKFLKKILPEPIWNIQHFFYGWLGARKYGKPSEELLVVGITGTSGKSSTVALLRQLLESSGFVVGSLSTIDFSIAGENKLNDQKMTMLGRAQIQKYLREMVDKGCQIAIVETTSEGVLQHRHRFINYDIVLYTNLYPEHIEHHGSFENYKKAKLDIFRYIANGKRKAAKTLAFKHPHWKDIIPKIGIANGNSEHASDFLQFSFDEKGVFLRLDKEKEIQTIDFDLVVGADDISIAPEGIAFQVDGYEMKAHMYGEYNVMNILSAISIARALGVSYEKIQKSVQAFRGVPGRIELISQASDYGFQVIVDYAFEPIAIEALYKVVELMGPKRVIHVFGSTGGGRDIERRFTVGKFVAKHADICIITDEDPYDDDPQAIIDDVVSACQEGGKTLDKDLFSVLDRKMAITKAIHMAKAGDVVLITGKGSEQAMVVKGTLIPWDDRDIARGAIETYEQAE
ncbi:UDP-N-acetylmuramyl-tripeptide synthetase [Candidatus Nomurabacteria bacterium]|nr:UDP-N-acetylmuramyl-tripeptide synthetase [Candidatus Nomurabacteria bacterium]